MADISIHRQHGSTLKKAKAVAQKVADRLAEDYDLESEWEGDTLHFQRAGVHGQLNVDAKAIDIHIRLGMLLRPFKGHIEEQVQATLDRLLGA